ncbi:flavin reductase [Neptunomonas japonica]|uniref:flavin reductase n=1 Tax=Neptunomonas japonica TaxID=417574 RepID=UPI0004109A1A|nr:flavin reductase [Neptunomonas japonica]
MFTNGVSIILTGTNDDYKGMAIAWVSQVEKEHLIISIPKGAKATNLLLKRKAFSVNELGLGQEDLAREFGGKNCEHKPNASLAKINSTEHNLPIILNCCSSTICRTLNVVEINEQVVITAEIISSENHLGIQPLIFNKAVYFK